jgi:DNA-binding MarR family transcriptional regulator
MILIVNELDLIAPPGYARAVAAPDVLEVPPIPALLRTARGAYGDSIRLGLAANGFDDMPLNGPFVLGTLARSGASAVELARWLGLSKQAVSQLLDTLVLRGYITREVDPDDRRRMVLALSERGRAAAEVTRDEVEAIDEELGRRLKPDELAGFIAGLRALSAIRHEQRDPEGD